MASEVRRLQQGVVRRHKSALRPACRLWLGLLLIALAGRLAAADAPAIDPDATVATVDGEPISFGEVRAGVEANLQGRQVAPENMPVVEAAVLGQLIDRRLVDAVVAKSGAAVTEAQVDAALTQIRIQLEQQKTVWLEYLRERRMSEDAFRKQLTWQLTWDKFVQRHLTDAVFEEYFKAHHQEFDGSEVRVSHVLFRPQRSNQPDQIGRLIAEASQVREQITSGKITFEAAVKKYSAGPSRERGGDLGYIPRHGMMVEPFAQAAFRLQPGEISHPVVTPFGVHLIRAEEVKPGNKKWTDVRDQFKQPVAQELYLELAHQQRAKAKITFSGLMAHFKPGTKELVNPKKPAAE